MFDKFPVQLSTAFCEVSSVAQSKHCSRKSSVRVCQTYESLQNETTPAENPLPSTRHRSPKEFWIRNRVVWGTTVLFLAEVERLPLFLETGENTGTLSVTVVTSCEQLFELLSKMGKRSFENRDIWADYGPKRLELEGLETPGAKKECRNVFFSKS